MSRVFIVSNDKEYRGEIQKEVNSFPDKTEISSIVKHISEKYGCDAEVGFPRGEGEKRYVYCFFPT